MHELTEKLTGIPKNLCLCLYTSTVLYHVIYGKNGYLVPLHHLCVELLQLQEAEKFHYLNQSGCISDPTINDAKEFDNVRDIIVLFS